MIPASSSSMSSSSMSSSQKTYTLSNGKKTTSFWEWVEDDMQSRQSSAPAPSTYTPAPTIHILSNGTKTTDFWEWYEDDKRSEQSSAPTPSTYTPPSPPKTYTLSSREKTTDFWKWKEENSKPLIQDCSTRRYVHPIRKSSLKVEDAWLKHVECSVEQISHHEFEQEDQAMRVHTWKKLTFAVVFHATDDAQAFLAQIRKNGVPSYGSSLAGARVHVEVDYCGIGSRLRDDRIATALKALGDKKPELRQELNAFVKQYERAP